MPRSMTRQRLIDVGVQRFYRDGFRNVGIDQILNEVGISKTAFYKHFESKEDLMLAALEDNNCRVQEMFSRVDARAWRRECDRAAKRANGCGRTNCGYGGVP